MIDEAKAIAENRRVVSYFARRYAGRHDTLREDLEQVGMIALVQSARGWRPDGGANFRHYAITGARRSMLRYRRRSADVHISVHKYEQAHCVSANEEHEGLELLDTDAFGVQATQADDYDREERRAIVRRELEKLLPRLPERERKALQGHFDGKSIRDLAGELGCSKRRVAQLLDPSLEWLKPRLARALDGDP